MVRSNHLGDSCDGDLEPNDLGSGDLGIIDDN